MDLALFFQHLANGISLGSLYALIAIGYTMVYGILRLINFAHGDLLMMSAYIVFYGMLVFALPWWLSVVLAVLLTAALGMGIERAAYRPLRDSPRISVLISAIGVSFFLQNLGIVVFGGRAKAVYRPAWLAATIDIGGVSITTLALLIPGVTLILLLMLSHLVYRTKTGMAMRAVSRDYDTARLMGIDVDRIISFTFVTGSALAAVGGIMWALRYPQIHPMIGVMPGLKCFVAAVFGGIGNIPGAVLGGFLLGIGEIMLVAFIPNLAGYRDAFAFVILILTLLFRPTGLLGEKMAEKV
ncbi:MAG: branched-chain amino acid ABC transporter permease [Bacillota bacterium]|jgi:branched-chain amino acid transport system permease protein|nr:branched-chain amino acid ABC transporter permease [Candidatus Fermentithermobacillaceae bacterium]